MPVKKRSISVLKRARQSARRHKVNRGRKLRLKKGLHVARAVRTKKEATETLPVTQSLIDKASRRGIIHPNKAARLKSQLARRAAKLT